MYFIPILLIVLQMLNEFRRKKSLSVMLYVLFLYLVISLFAIPVYEFDIRCYDNHKWILSFDATIMYTTLLLICIYPLRHISVSIKIKQITNYTTYNIIILLFFCVFCLTLLLGVGKIYSVLIGGAGELGDLRRNISAGVYETRITDNNLLHFIINTFGSFSMIMLPIFFYNMSILKKGLKSNIIIFISSLTVLLLSVVSVDRSRLIYWLLDFVLSYLLFRKSMTNKQKMIVERVLILVVTMILAYFVMVTISRFNGTSTGSLGFIDSIISYAGQSYLNFCYFYENVHYSEFSLQRIFPLVYKLFIDNGITSSPMLNEEIFFNTGKPVNFFSTFIGDIMVACGSFVTIIYCFIYNRVLTIVAKSCSKKTVTLGNVLILYVLCLVLVNGLFIYYYATVTLTFCILLLFCVKKWLK